MAGYGLARAPVTANSPIPTVSVPLSAITLTQPAVVSSADPCRLSVWGGGLVTIAGNGFVDGISSPPFARKMKAYWDVNATDFCSGTSCTTGIQAAARTGPLSLDVESASGRTATLRLGRYTAPGSNLPARLKYNLLVSNTVTNAGGRPAVAQVWLP